MKKTCFNHLSADRTQSKVVSSIIFAGLTSAVGLSSIGVANAQSAADLLMQAAGPVVEGSQGSSTLAAASTNESVLLNTPIARIVFAEWNSSRNKGSATNSYFEANSWVRLFLSEKFEAAAHLWTSVSSKMPESFLEVARAAHLYSLYRVNVPQTFFDQWTYALASKNFVDNRASAALEETLAPDFENWFLKNAIQISPDAAAIITKLGPDRSIVLMTLTAASFERKGEAGADLLVRLPVQSAFRPRLAQTVAVALARKRDLGGAGRVLKTFYEPWLMTQKDARKTSSYYLQIARLLYQAASFDAAIQFYEKIPNGSYDYLTAREELAWCWLRQGASDKLRGNLKSLTSKLLEDIFQPEAYLVRSISNLKLCYHAEVEKDFTDFLKVNAKWAQKIQHNLKVQDPDLPRLPDFYSQRAITAQKAREEEALTLKGLAERSIAAVLPAVGPQKIWTDALQRSNLNIETAKKSRLSEFRRQWKNDQATLVEAIRKMQFVKVELMSQVAMLSATDASLNSSETSAKSTKALEQASGDSTTQAELKKRIKNEADMVFPFDGVLWPDELFKLRAQSSNQCLGHL